MKPTWSWRCWPVAGGYNPSGLVAALGGRLDQTLANINLLLLPELADRDVRLFDGIEEVFLIRDQVTIHGQPGEIVSLIPLQGPVTGITTRGLQYPLRLKRSIRNARVASVTACWVKPPGSRWKTGYCCASIPM